MVQRFINVVEIERCPGVKQLELRNSTKKPKIHETCLSNYSPYLGTRDHGTNEIPD